VFLSLTPRTDLGEWGEKAIVSVKAGEHVSVAMIRDMGHVVDREKTKVGSFIALAEATSVMKGEAVKAGFYELPTLPKLQILTIADQIRREKSHKSRSWMQRVPRRHQGRKPLARAIDPSLRSKEERAPERSEAQLSLAYIRPATTILFKLSWRTTLGHRQRC
jgi:hypothetical protein